ncbi:alpha/beta hydrolase [Protofrankia coriariae]|uniref:Carboxylesterase n=1 Tax=Protofrankia coriariae TaxID=1562887 RepID=A0ABR5F1E0_9ACTN|nr:alpha/beta fold hydrolase [Protofrankia coriariae]KLL10538.1 carboxylesterase [Protofrankia coriariae]
MAGVPRRSVTPGTSVVPGAEPFEHDGGDTGVLLIHGFTGTPQSMRPWGTFLAEAGLTVCCPLLPGHGTRWQEMNGTTWHDWFGAAEDAFIRLRERCSTVFVMGLSMGGTLTLRLAEVYGPALAGVVTVNPSLGTDRKVAALAPALSRVIPCVVGVGSDIKAAGTAEVAYRRLPLRAFVSLRELWAVTVADLGRVTSPILTFRSRVDHVVEATSGRILLAGATSSTVSERILENSYHVATLDNDRHTIFEGSLQFVDTHTVVSG